MKVTEIGITGLIFCNVKCKEDREKTQLFGEHLQMRLRRNFLCNFQFSSKNVLCGEYFLIRLFGFISCFTVAS